MKTVMAQGVFDIIHPGHIHYLQKSAELGDQLVVVVARDSRINQQKELYFSENERKRILNALEPVNKAILGSEENIYDTVKRVNPEIITLGYDQKHEVSKVKKMAEKALNKKVEVRRIEAEKPKYSSSKIKQSQR